MRIKIIETLIVMFLDIIVIGLSFALSYYLRLGTFSHSIFPFEPYIQMAMVMIPIWIMLLLFSGRYNLQDQSLFSQIKHIIFASLASSLLFPLLFYFSENQFFSRGIIFLIFIIGVLLLFLISYIFRYFRQWKVKKNMGISRMLVIGAGKNSQNIIKNLLLEYSFHKPVAILTPYGSKLKEISGVPILGKLDSLEKIFISEKIDEIFLCEAVEHSENLASFCRNKGIVLRTSLDTLGIKHHSINTETIGNTTFLTLQQSPLFGWGQFFKRFFDITISIFGLIIFAPYFLINRKDLTYTDFANGKKTIFKGLVFRNSKNKEHTIYAQNISLLWNVLQKDISIVGPKVFEKNSYNEVFKTKKEQTESRFILRPGLFSSYIIYNKSAESIMRADILYIRNWSFWNDISIIYKNYFSL